MAQTASFGEPETAALHSRLQCLRPSGTSRRHHTMEGPSFACAAKIIAPTVAVADQMPWWGSSTVRTCSLAFRHSTEQSGCSTHRSLRRCFRSESDGRGVAAARFSEFGRIPSLF